MSPAAKGPRGCSTCVLHRQAGLGEGRAPDTCHSGVSSGRLGNPKCPNSHAEAVTKLGRKEAHSALPPPPLGRSATGRAMLLASFLSRGPGGLPCNGTRNGSSSLQAARNNGGGETMPLRCPAAETETPGGGPVHHHARQVRQQAPDGPTWPRRVPSQRRGAGTFRAVTWWCSLTGGAGDAGGPESEAGGQVSQLRGLP